MVDAQGLKILQAIPDIASAKVAEITNCQPKVPSKNQSIKVNTTIMLYNIALINTAPKWLRYTDKDPGWHQRIFYSTSCRKSEWQQPNLI